MIAYMTGYCGGGGFFVDLSSRPDMGVAETPANGNQ